MKNFYILLLIILFQKTYAQYTVITDVNFEQELINQEIDSNSIVDGQILTSSINTITSLNINSQIAANIINLNGLEDFTSLQELIFFSAGSLQIINISQNLYLKKIVLINPQISYLNTSSNLALETLYLYYASQLSTIDLSHNTNLKDLEIGNFNIAQLNLINNIYLEKLRLNNTLISQLDLTNNTLLKYVYSLNNPIATIDLSYNLSLEYLYIASSFVSNIDLSQNLNLKYLSLYINPIQNLDVGNNMLLEELGCSNNLLISLNLNNNPFLNKVLCKNYISSFQNNFSSLNLQNDANNLLNGVYDIGSGSIPPTYSNRFDSTNNPNLNCIFVDDVANCNINWLGKDPTSNYVSSQQECNQLDNYEFVVESETIVYPNPVKEILYLESNSEIQETIVYDLFGKVILEQNEKNTTKINFSNISNGLYFVKIVSKYGTIVKKIIKK